MNYVRAWLVCETKPWEERYQETNRGKRPFQRDTSKTASQKMRGSSPHLAMQREGHGCAQNKEGGLYESEP